MKSHAKSTIFFRREATFGLTVADFLFTTLPVFFETTLPLQVFEPLSGFIPTKRLKTNI